MQYRQPLSAGSTCTFRADYRTSGETWFEPYNITSRDPIDLARPAPRARRRASGRVTAWAKNLTDEEYNPEFSPGGFLFKALPPARASSSRTRSDRSSKSWPSRQSCPRGCTTRRTSREPRGDPQVLRGRHRPAAARDLVREGHAVRRRAHLLPLFFGLADGGALAFFQFADAEDQEQFGPKMPFTPFHHIALHVDKETQDGIEKRLKEAGYKEPQSFVLEHGYCRSVYATDPNGMIVEFTLDHPDVEKINATRRGQGAFRSSSAGSRAITPRTTLPYPADDGSRAPRLSTDRIDHARRQPAALAGGHRRAVRPRARHVSTDAAAAPRRSPTPSPRSCAARWRPASTSSATAR